MEKILRLWTTDGPIEIQIIGKMIFLNVSKLPNRSGEGWTKTPCKALSAEDATELAAALVVAANEADERNKKP